MGKTGVRQNERVKTHTPFESWREHHEKTVREIESIAWTVDGAALYSALAHNLLDVLACEGASIRLLSLTGSDLVGMASYVSDNDALSLLSQSYSHIPTSIGRMPMLLETHEPILMDFLNPHEEDVIPNVHECGSWRSAASIPLVFEGSVVGVYDALWRKARTWSDDEIDNMLNIGKLYGLVVGREMSHQSVLELRVLEESRRLSAEIHDNLAQLINTVKIEAEKAAMAFEEGDEELVGEGLSKIETTSQQAADIIRDEMLALRDVSTGLSGEIVSDVRGCIDRFGRQWGIDAALHLEGISERLVVSKRMEMQLLRILHESLANVFRHAMATRVAVFLKSEGGFLSLRVGDNGQGFKVNEVPPERLGLRIMKERAELLGGEVEVRSTIGEGTEVRVSVPYLA